MGEATVFRIISSTPGYEAVHPPIGGGIDKVLARSLRLAYSAGEYAASPLKRQARRVVVELDDGSVIVVWRKGEEVIGVYAEPSKPWLQAARAPLL